MYERVDKIMAKDKRDKGGETEVPYEIRRFVM